jgi:hypothetical protein
MPWNLEPPYLARNPCRFTHSTLPEQAVVSLHSLDSTEPISTMIQSHLFALLCLAPSGASAPIRPAPGAMAAQRSTPSGTSNNLPLPHLSSSACDEDRRARGYTQSCSSILLSTNTCLPYYLSPAHLQSIPPLFMVHWRPDSCRSPSPIVRRSPSSFCPLFLQTLSLLCALDFNPP